MNQTSSTARPPSFLSGGGNLGRLMREYEWANSPLGPPGHWPQSLKSAVSICLGTTFPIAIYWGEELALLYNDAWSTIPGNKHPRALGRPGREVWPEIWDEIGPLFARVRDTGEGVWQQDQLLPMRRHGYTEECYFNFTFSPIRGEDGAVEGIFNAVVETTFRVIGERRERALRDISERLATARSEQNVVAAATEAISRYREDIPFCFFFRQDQSGGSARLIAGTGFQSPDRLIGLEGYAPDAVWPLSRSEKSGHAVAVSEFPEEFRVLLSPGPWPEPVIAAYVQVLPTFADATYHMIAGVSARRRLDEEYTLFMERMAAHVAAALANAEAYEQQRKRAEALAELDRAKTLFFSNVSHEFRTPLTLMLAPLEDMLASGELPESERQRLDVAHRNALRLLKLVNSLLDFARIESGRIHARYEPLDLAALTADLASNFRSACERAGLRLVVDCPPLQHPVYADRDMWEKIVLNLLSNAFKFTFQGEITVQLRALDAHAELSVSDTGVGIPEHELPHLFERFHRIEGQQSRTYEGSGIGLALVQELVKLNSGKIAVKSPAGEGTTFTVSVPFGTAHLPMDHVSARQTTASSSVRAETYVEEALRWLPDSGGDSKDRLAGEAAPESRALVLVADDNSDMRDYLRRLLRNYCEVETVADGQAALEAIRRRRPELVITDVMMPRLDGFGLLRAIRDDPELKSIQVIMLSARAGEESRIESLAAGADDFLVKPFSRREVIARVDGNLKLARVRADASRELRAREERFRMLADNMDQLAWTCDSLGEATWYNRRWLEYTGLSFEEMKDWGWKRVQHPDHIDRVIASVTHARETGQIWEETFPLRGADGVYRWFLSRAVPVRDAAGKIIQWFGTNTDITEQRRAEEAQRMLTGELSHRVKNMLATVQAIATQTLRHNSDPVNFVASFGGRIQSMARVHSMLSSADWQGADLREIIRDQLLLGAVDGSRVTSWGPMVRLEPQMAPQVAMMLHELGTNSIKYGALSTPDGTVRIVWSVNEDLLRLQWIEHGGPRVTAPVRRGFGTRLIQQSSKSAGGSANMSIEADGVQWDISLPLPRPMASSGNAKPALAANGIEALPGNAGLLLPDLVGKRFLVVEDEALVALEIVACLEKMGVEVVDSVGSITEALALIDRFTLDAVLLDANLHGQAVGDVAAALTRKNVPFAFVTGYGRDSLPTAFAATPTLSKPFSQQQLLETAAKLVQRSGKIRTFEPRAG